MGPGDYRLRLFGPEHLDGVVDFMAYLWGGDSKKNMAFFRWKYYDNPYAKVQPGIIAFYKDAVVGFRGYVPSKWYIPARRHTFEILSPADTCVHPEHRRRGLSVEMGRLAMETYQTSYAAFLNLGATANSVPGYLKMGFAPLCQKTILSRYNPVLFSLGRFGAWIREQRRRIETGEFGDIMVSGKPLAGEMSEVVSKRNSGDNRIVLSQGDDFFRWRFNNPRNRYIFYYLKRDNLISAYIVLFVSRDDRFANIIDYAETETGGIEDVLRFIIKMKHVGVLSIWDCSLSREMRRVLSGFGFSSQGRLINELKKKNGVWPALARPVGERCTEVDWFVEGIDFRHAENWELKEICLFSS